MNDTKKEYGTETSTDVESGMTSKESLPYPYEEEEQELEEIHPISTISMQEVTRTTSHLSRIATNKSRAESSRMTPQNDPKFYVDWAEGDPENPKNWPTWKKSQVVFACTLSSATCILYSSAYMSGIPTMTISLNITNETVALLGLTTFLLGFAVGSLLWAPLSETFGRRPVYLATLSTFLLFILACALAQNLTTMLVARFFAGMLGCTAVSNSPGSINDIVTARSRALAFSCWGLGVMNGPVLGPLVGGFTEQYLSWRWIHWIVLILATVSFLCIATVPETFKPTLIRQRTARLHKESGDERWWNPFDQEATSLKERMFTALTRPFSLTLNEPILWFWDFFIMITYAIVYLYFVLYPKVFNKTYSFTPSQTGLSYLGIGLGNVLTVSLEPLIRRWTSTLKISPATNLPLPESKVAPVCVAALLMPLGAFWFALTCSDPNIPWIVPILSGVPFGAGTSAAFIYGCTYVAECYGQFATSALAGNVVVRVVAGATLPLAGPVVFERLGGGGRGMGLLLAGLEAAILVVPFGFWVFGERIRAASKVAR